MAQNFDKKAQKITNISFNICSIGKYNRLQEYILVLLYLILYKAGLIPASTLLGYLQRLYACWLLSLLDQYPAKQILPISLKIRYGVCQPRELPNNTLMWTQDTRPILYGQWLAWQIIIEHFIDPADGVEPVEKISPDSQFQEEVFIECKKQVLVETIRYRTGLVI